MIVCTEFVCFMISLNICDLKKVETDILHGTCSSNLHFTVGRCLPERITQNAIFCVAFFVRRMEREQHKNPRNLCLSTLCTLAGSFAHCMETDVGEENDLKPKKVKAVFLHENFLSKWRNTRTKSAKNSFFFALAKTPNLHACSASGLRK